jgi:hypothetical protein
VEAHQRTETMLKKEKETQRENHLAEIQRETENFRVKLEEAENSKNSLEQDYSSQIASLRKDLLQVGTKSGDDSHHENLKLSEEIRKLTSEKSDIQKKYDDELSAW